MKNKKMLILFAAVLIVVIAVIVVVALPQKEYTDVHSSSEIYEQIKGSFVTEGGTKILDSDVILDFCDDEPDYLVDYTVVKANNAKNINEIGIFKVENGKAEEFVSYIKAYVESTQQRYRAMDYFPEEVEKINCATYKIFGNYVVYSFLNESDTNAFYSAFEALIQK